MDFVHWIGSLRTDLPAPTTRRERLQAAMVFYARFLAEDPIDGSQFDCEVLEALTELARKHQGE